MSSNSGATLLKDSGFLNELNQIRAKAVLTEVVRDVPQYKWTYSSRRFSRNITAGLYDLLRRAKKGEVGPTLKEQARTLAQAWESLSKLEDGVPRRAGLLNAAYCYELAGYQANAACLARKVAPTEWNPEQMNFLDLASAFLQRLFVLARSLEQNFQHEPSTAISEHELVYRAALAIASQGIGQVSKYFLSGREEYFKAGQQLFSEAELGFASVGSFNDANAISAIQALVPVMRERSTWVNLPVYTSKNSIWERYKLLLARGVGRDVLKSSSISELWPSQLTALEGNLLSPGSKVLRMPTSAGKTRIAEIAIVYAFTFDPGSKCVYVAPYRALVSEVEQQFQTLFSDLGLKVSTLAGSFESDPFEEYLVGEADLLIVTPEKLDLVLRLKPEYIESVSLVVVDEGHVIQEGQRGIKLELLLTRLKRRLKNASFLFISAVVPDETLQELAEWLKADSGILSSEWRAPLQRFASFTWSGDSGQIKYSPHEEEGLRGAFVPGIIRQRTYEWINPITGRKLRRLFPDHTKAQYAAELAYIFAAQGPVLVFGSQRNHVVSVAEALLTRLEYARNANHETAKHFNTPDTMSSQLAAEWLGEDHVLSRCLKNGIAFHHGGLPERVRKAVETDFHDGHYKFIAATNTLAQGVNLPLKTVIFHSVWRHSEDGQSRISSRDYWNIAGRVGRARYETEGTIIHIVLTPNDQKDIAYFLSRRKKLEPIEGALTQLLRAISEQRISEEAIIEALDADILALMVEEGADGSLIEKLAEAANDTWAAIQAKSRNLDSSVLSQTFQRVAQKISDAVPADRLPIFSDTGLKSASCNQIATAVQGEPGLWRSILTSSSAAQISQLCEFYLSVCQSMPEMQSDHDFSGSASRLLLNWVNGSSIQSLRQEFGTNVGAEELPNFVEDLFGYRLPWGISSVNKVAAAILEIDPGHLSTLIKYFPAMVKFGVPSPQASWAVSAGVPFRKAAISVAATFEREIYGEDVNSHSRFIQWLSDLEYQRWTKEFGVAAPSVHGIMRSLRASVRNSLLSQTELLPMVGQVHSTTDAQKYAIASLKGEFVADLVRDYDDLTDRNSIEVLVTGVSLGYLERQVAQVLAPYLDAGEQFSVKTHGFGTKTQVRIDALSI